MRKMARASILLIAVGVVLIPEAYFTFQGGSGGEGIISKGLSDVSPTFFLWRGMTFEGNITANATIDFYIMDEANYQAFVKGQSWQPSTSLLGVSNASFHYVAPASGYYRTVIILRPPEDSAYLTMSTSHYGIDRDHLDSGLAFILIGAILGAITLISFPRLKLFSKTAERTHLKNSHVKSQNDGRVNSLIEAPAGFEHQFTRKRAHNHSSNKVFSQLPVNHISFPLFSLLVVRQAFFVGRVLRSNQRYKKLRMALVEVIIEPAKLTYAPKRTLYEIQSRDGSETRG